MPLGLRRGAVTAVHERRDEFARLEVDGLPCVAYPRLTGPVEVGDDVLVNEQARLLGLGSGGFDVLYANLTRGLGLPVQEGAHVMKLPYTPGQLALGTVEESGRLAASLVALAVLSYGARFVWFDSDYRIFFKADNPQSLTPDEVYALCAYLLYLNGIVPEDAVMDAQTLPQVKM